MGVFREFSHVYHVASEVSPNNMGDLSAVSLSPSLHCMHRDTPLSVSIYEPIYFHNTSTMHPLCIVYHGKKTS